MAAPSIVATTEYALTTAGTTATPTFTQTTGDLVLIFLSLSVAGTISPGDSFVNLTNINANFHILYKELVGSEGGNVAITITSSKACAIAYNLQDFSTPPEFATVTTGTSTGPDSGNLVPSAGGSECRFFSTFYQAGEEADDDTWCNAAPSGYSGLVQKTTGIGGTPATNSSVAAANRTGVFSSDPDAFNTDQSLAWRAYTVAVLPVVVASERVPRFSLYPQILAH